MSDYKLPPIEKESFDGYKEEATLHRDQPLPKTCQHKGVQIISATELRCGCGNGWHGDNIVALYKLFKEQA